MRTERIAPTLPHKDSTTLGQASIIAIPVPTGDLQIEIGWRRRPSWRTDGPGAAGYVALRTQSRRALRGERPLTPERLRDLAASLTAYAAELASWQLAEAIEDQQRAELAS